MRSLMKRKCAGGNSARQPLCWPGCDVGGTPPTATPTQAQPHEHTCWGHGNATKGATGPREKARSATCGDDFRALFVAQERGYFARRAGR